MKDNVWGLARVIAAHGFAVRVVNGRELWAESVWTRDGGRVTGATWERVTPSAGAVRDWLGY